MCITDCHDMTLAVKMALNWQYNQPTKWQNLRLVQTECICTWQNIWINPLYTRYEQCLLFQQCFKRLVQQTRKNKGLLGKELNGLHRGGEARSHRQIPTYTISIMYKITSTCSFRTQFGLLAELKSNLTLKYNPGKVQILGKVISEWRHKCYWVYYISNTLI